MRRLSSIGRALLGASTSSVLIALLIAATSAASMTACGGGDSSGPSAEDVCSRVTLGGIRTNCTSVESSISNIQYDQFGRRISWNFDVRCTTSSERYTGRVISVTYNNVGQALSARVEVNGKTCNVS